MESSSELLQEALRFWRSYMPLPLLVCIILFSTLRSDFALSLSTELRTTERPPKTRKRQDTQQWKLPTIHPTLCRFRRSLRMLRAIRLRIIAIRAAPKRTSKRVAQVTAEAATTFAKSRRHRCVNSPAIGLTIKSRVVPRKAASATIWTSSLICSNNRRATSNNRGSRRVVK